MTDAPPPGSSDPPPPVADVVLRVADTIGALMEFWGFKRNMGRLWALLYMDLRPLSAAEIGERLSLSSGGVSMLLAELLQWGVVKKSWVPGERRDYYEPETSIWKMVSRVFRERELRQIHGAIETFEQATSALQADQATADSPQARLALERIAGLDALARVGAHLLESMLQGESIDILPIKSLSDLAAAAERAQRARDDEKK
jgi:HTH-type transcriptional regulator, glycine betaine synthesis regulator